MQQVPVYTEVIVHEPESDTSINLYMEVRTAYAPLGLGGVIEEVGASAGCSRWVEYRPTETGVTVEVVPEVDDEDERVYNLDLIDEAVRHAVRSGVVPVAVAQVMEVNLDGVFGWQR